MGGTIQFVEVDPSKLRWPHHEREFHCAPACVCVHACEHHMVCDVVLGRLWLLTGGLQSNYLGYGGMGQQTVGCTLHQTCADLSCSHLPGSITNARGRKCACAQKKQKTCYWAVTQPRLIRRGFAPNFICQGDENCMTPLPPPPPPPSFYWTTVFFVFPTQFIHLRRFSFKIHLCSKTVSFVGIFTKQSFCAALMHCGEKLTFSGIFFLAHVSHLA